MTTSNTFTEYYKTISNTELLNILENSADYQPLSVETAKEEFNKRQLTDNDIQQAREPLIAKKEQKEREREKIKTVETNIKTAGQTIIDTLNPIQPGIQTTEKTIRLIVIIFGGLFLYQLSRKFGVHLAFIKDILQFPLESSLYLLHQMLLSVATFLFWKRKATGWILLSAYLHCRQQPYCCYSSRTLCPRHQDLTISCRDLLQFLMHSNYCF